jgi:hypothetical protein
MLLSVALISTSVPAKVQASWFSDLCGGIFTILSAPIWVFCQDNEFFRRQNSFRKKPWEERAQEERDRELAQKKELEREERLAARIIGRLSSATPQGQQASQDSIDYGEIVNHILAQLPSSHGQELDYERIGQIIGQQVEEAVKKETEKRKKEVDAAVAKGLASVKKEIAQQPQSPQAQPEQTQAQKDEGKKKIIDTVTFKGMLFGVLFSVKGGLGKLHGWLGGGLGVMRQALEGGWVQEAEQAVGIKNTGILVAKVLLVIASTAYVGWKINGVLSIFGTMTIMGCQVPAWLGYATALGIGYYISTPAVLKKCEDFLALTNRTIRRIY